jgi:integrase/recombinase XerD
MALDYWVEFFQELEFVRGRSINTVSAYRRDLELYQEFIKKKNKTELIYEFMTKKKLSARSQARVISSIRTYLKFCESKGKKIPELKHLRPPRVKTALPKAVTYEDFQKIHNAATTNNPYKTARNHITLLLLYGLGARVSELINVSVHDLNETGGYLSVMGKGGKERLIPLTAHVLNELKAYLKEARPHLTKDTETSILVNDKGHRPSRVDIWRWLAVWAKNAGFDAPISPHKFRHGCATALLEGGADLRSIQMLLGHSSIQTTQIYTSVSAKQLREEVDKHHPLSGFRDIKEL